jgi:hypothetical protein
MAQILEITETELGLIVLVEGFPLATPIFPLDTPEEDIQQLVDSWCIIQNEIDSINNGTASPEIIDKHTPKIPFNADKAIAREAQVFSMDRIIALAPFTYTINEMIRYENWLQLKQMIGGLIQADVATQDDYDKFNSILKEQNVDLDLI